MLRKRSSGRSKYFYERKFLSEIMHERKYNEKCINNLANTHGYCRRFLWNITCRGSDSTSWYDRSWSTSSQVDWSEKILEIILFQKLQEINFPHENMNFTSLKKSDSLHGVNIKSPMKNLPTRNYPRKISWALPMEQILPTNFFPFVVFLGYSHEDFTDENFYPGNFYPRIIFPMKIFFIGLPTKILPMKISTGEKTHG